MAEASVWSSLLPAVIGGLIGATSTHALQARRDYAKTLQDKCENIILVLTNLEYITTKEINGWKFGKKFITTEINNEKSKSSSLIAIYFPYKTDEDDKFIYKLRCFSVM